MTPVLIVAIVFGSLIIMKWISVISKERQAEGQQGGAVGMRELEERIQRAVTTSVEPLREQVAALEERLNADGTSGRIERQRPQDSALAFAPPPHEEERD